MNELELLAQLRAAQEARMRALMRARSQHERYGEHIETVFYLDGEILELTNKLKTLRQGM